MPNQDPSQYGFQYGRECGRCAGNEDAVDLHHHLAQHGLNDETL